MKSNTNIKEGYKKTAVGVIPEEWKKVKLRDIAERVTRRNKELNDTVITISAQRGLILQEDYFTKRVASDTLSNYYLLHRGEFAYNKSYSNGYPMGAFKRLDDFEKAVVTTLYICFKIKDNIDTDFLLNYFEAGLLVRNLMKIAQEGGRAHGLLNIGIEDFFNLKLSIPSLPEQQAIANCLTTWDKGIETLTALIKAKREQKKGLMQQLLTGKKRLDGFTGEWKKIKLGNIGTFRTSSVNKIIEKDETKVWLLNYMDVYNNTHITSKIDFQLTSAKNTQIASSNLEVGDVLFTPSSETPDDIGHSAVVTENLNNVVFSYHLVRFRAKRNILDIKFSGYVFNKTEILNEFSRRATGSTRYTLSLKDFNEIETTIPPIDEQTAIAHILTTADQEISLLEKKLEAMKEEKKGLMQVLLTGVKRLKIES